MSELTRCNRCTLNDIKRRAADAGKKVTLGRDENGWTTVTVEGEDEPRAHLMELTNFCVC